LLESAAVLEALTPRSVKVIQKQNIDLGDLHAAIASQVKQKAMGKIQKEKQEKDPFLRLGVGCVAYRTLLRSLSALFLVLSLMVLPVMKIYSEGGGYNPSMTHSKYANYSLGNMGFESQQCAFVPLTMSKLFLQCEYGSITKMTSYGINTFDQKIRDACIVDTHIENDYCSPIFDDGYMNSEFNDNCKGV
jgi:hypothetical protein